MSLSSVLCGLFFVFFCFLVCLCLFLAVCFENAVFPVILAFFGLVLLQIFSCIFVFGYCYLFFCFLWILSQDGSLLFVCVCVVLLCSETQVNILLFFAS